MRLASVSLYFHTLRHLRGSQIRARAWRAIRRIRPELGPAPVQRALAHAWQLPCATAGNLAAPDRFTALGETHGIAGPQAWNDEQRSALWLYNLHYFDELNSIGADRRLDWQRDLLRRWLAENPPGHGVGWQPYPLARRIVNWIKWHLRGHAGDAASLDSLAAQVRWLSRDLEVHIGGNHLLADAKALVFAGAFFSGTEGDRWLRTGMRILAQEVTEQVLRDGGHYELSPMYHAAVLEDLLDTLNVLEAFGLDSPSGWRDRARQMLEWGTVMTHPDGQVSFFNDAAFDIAPPIAELAEYASRLKLPPPLPSPDFAILEHSGYVRARAGEAWLACDCAQVGPDYLPGHAHADTLSFELSLGDGRWLVNSGTSVYGNGPERQRQRGTAAHNTVVVDGRDSSEVWGGFRVARRARARLVAATAAAASFQVEASHDGYRRLSGGNLHRRQWRLDATSLSIADHVTGRFASASARFHLHPEVTAEKVSASEVRLVRGGRIMQLSVNGAKHLEVAKGTWHPRFGSSMTNCRVSVDFGAAELHTHFDWSPVQ